MVVAAIVACEVLFWVLLLGGLSARYLLRLRWLSTVLLLLVPVLDVALLLIIAWHLRSGGHADASLGFTVAYGHSMIAWADARFAHRFMGGPPPPQRPRRGWAALRYETVGWVRGLVAAGVGAAVLAGLIWYVGDPARTAELQGFFPPLAGFTVINTVVFVWGCVEAVLPSRGTADTESVAR
jgi:hypothetical protein